MPNFKKSSGFKMKGMSFSSSPMKDNGKGKLSKKKKDLKTGKDITPKSKSGLEKFIKGPQLNPSVDGDFMSRKGAITTLPGKKKKKTETDTARDMYFNL
mgnify:CR=1 FL=1|tara:strand:+ start:237 stop:533 length:297 start_codon:yes stop_codon:yes gene_type:complete